MSLSTLLPKPYNDIIVWQGGAYMPVNSFENYPMSWNPSMDRNSRSLYKILAHQLEQDIMNGNLLPGTRLPPQRELADFLDINLSTVSKAFKLCEEKGLLSAKIGSGTYVAFDALSKTQLLPEETCRHIIEMGATVPDYEANKLLVQQLQSMLAEPDSGRFFAYNRPGQAIWQKDAAVMLMKKMGLTTGRDHILLSSGGQNAIAAILSGLFQSGDKIGVAPHTYSDMKVIAMMLGIQLVPIPQENHEFDHDALRFACKNYGLKALYVIPDHQNPTTHTMSETARAGLAAVAQEQDIMIIEDCAYRLMSGGKFLPIAVYAPERTILIASLSKSVAPGIRIAYVAVPSAYRSRLANAIYNINISVSPLLAELAARIIVSGQLDAILEQHKQQTNLRNKIVDQYLHRYDCRGEASCIFRWLLLPGDIKGAAFETLALQNGVQVYSAERFAVGTTLPAKAVRMAICAPESIDQLERGLIIIKKLLDRI